MSKRIGIIGGGAAGFFAAIHAARSNPAASVTILEGSKKPLAKVLISGGGRCNVTNNCLDPAELIRNYPRGSRELRGAFSRFAVQDTIDWFQGEGVSLKAEPDNRIFPVTDSSETIAKSLQNAARAAGVTTLLAHKIHSISCQAEGVFTVTTANDEQLIFDAIILTTGGSKQSFTLAASLGHTIAPGVPSLFTFQIEDSLLTDLAGLSFDTAALSLKVKDKKFEYRGPVLITHWGLSGPAIIKLSAIAARELFESNYTATLRIGFIGCNAEQAISELQKLKHAEPKKFIKNTNPFTIPKRFWERLLEISTIAEDKKLGELSKKEINLIVDHCVQHSFTVSGRGVFKEEFVTCGGVELKEVHFKTMESKIQPGLYFAGEVLNIDGITGGFNFQSAWTTGWIAGTSSASNNTS